MYKVCIADDEIWIAENLRISIDWAQFGFTFAGMAHNGREALELFRREKPDVVLTDIRMPELSGLDLARMIREINPATQVVIISGFADFSLARKAIDYGVIGYCVKPIDEREIEGYLVKARRQLDQRQSGQTDMLALLTERDEGASARMEALLESQGLSLRQGIRALALVGADVPVASATFPCLSFRSGPSRMTYLVQENAAAQVADHFWQLRDAALRGIGSGSTVFRAEALCDSVEQATEAAYGFFVTGHPGVFHWHEHGHEEVAQRLARGYALLRQKDMAGLADWMELVRRDAARGAMTLRQCIVLYNAVMFSGNSEQGREADLFVMQREEMLRLFSHAGDMMDALRDTLRDSRTREHAHTEQKVRNVVFSEVLDHLRLNYNKSLSLQDLAERFAFNASYLSQLFRKELDTSFTQYLTDLRIRHACDMLQDAGTTINAIAERVGYDDFLYFRKVFKKAMGMTPGEYRKQHAVPEEGH